MFFRMSTLLLSLFVCACSQAADRPNFLWLISEDNSKHFLQLFDSSGAPTPHIEALARDGLIFDHAFSNSPVCSVARSTLITGCYAPRIGTQFHRRSVTVPMPKGLQMFPAYLRQAGYYTTNKQKKDYNAVEGKGVWDASSRRASWRNREVDQPFFHMQSFTTTHESSLHFSAATMRNESTQTDPKSVVLAPYHPDTSTFRYTYARYHDRIRRVDNEIGAVVESLKNDGLLEDTFIFYFGDHGGVLPRGKGYAYESGLHVPLVVRIPEKWKRLAPAPRGSKIGGFVSFIDFGPTLLHLAGLKVPEPMDGRPFLGKTIALKELNSRDEAFGYADRFDEKIDFVRTLRKGRFKYMRSYQPFNFDGLQNNYRYKMLAYTEWRDLYHAGKLDAAQRQFFEPRTPEALYDLEADPHEVKNLAGVPGHAATLEKLRERLRSIVKGLPDLSFYPESYLAENAFDSPVPFGVAHQYEIAAMVDIADASLLPFAEAKPLIDAALDSANPLFRYWGLISCSSHRDAARPLVKHIKTMAAHDTDRLVRVRAAEFLALIGVAEPGPVVLAALAETQSPIEACLILNTLVMLRDGPAAASFDLKDVKVTRSKNKKGNVNRRLEYLLKN